MANKKQQDNPPHGDGREVVVDVGGDNGVGGGGHHVAVNSLGHFSLVDDVPGGVLDDLSGLPGRNRQEVLRRRVRRN